MTVTENIVFEVRRRITEEGIPRLLHCLSLLSESQVWYRPNDNSNAVGNLILHLDGNVRQWLIATFQQLPDNRKRDTEFDNSVDFTKAKLQELLRILLKDIEATLPKVKEQQLTQIINVQGYQETHLSILMHVTEHFSYHVGQVTYITKMLLDIDTAYYAGHDLG